MNCVKTFKNENISFINKYYSELKTIEEFNLESKLQNNLKDYFTKVTNFIFLLKQIINEAEDGSIHSKGLEELQDINYKLYEDIINDNYNRSYANPEYAAKEFGEDLGKLLCYVYANLRNTIESAFSYKLFKVTPAIELFNKVIEILINEDNAVESIHKAIYNNIMDNLETEREQKYKSFIDNESDYLGSIVMESDLEDLRYLYKYDSYITEREKKIVQYFNNLSYESVESMATTYTEGFKRGYINSNLDITKKNIVYIYYSIGFEKMARIASKQFEKMGLKSIFALYQPYYTNRQFKYDHRYDYALYLDEDYVTKYLECTEKACIKYSDKLGKFGGPAVIETFGEKSFEPKNKIEAASLSKEQRELDVNLKRKTSIIADKYMKNNEYSFTIIAYPVPEIGEKFEEIFEETIRVNNLDNKLYGDIQQCLIDALDKGDYVHILGRGINKTDLKVKLYNLNNPDKETIFENCRADVNIPVGEVFTSPVLKGTNGLLHVSEVFLNGLKYKDLEIELKDGMVAEYNCQNFSEEEENKKFIKENILVNNETVPIGEFAIGTNTTAYVMGQKYGIQDKLPILIAEKTGPHFAMGDTCYSMAEDNRVYNPDGKEIVAKDNECSILRKTDMSKAYFNCHTDITIPYNELGEISVYTKSGDKIELIKDGRFVLPGTESLNEPFNEL